MRKLHPLGRVHGLAVLLVLMLVAAACGGDDATQEEATETVQATEDDGGEATATETETEAVEHLGEATIMLGGKVITWAPTWVAVCEGFFEDHGLTVTVTPSEGGTTPAIAALVSGEILSAMTGSAAGIGPIREGAPVKIAIVASEGYGVQLTASNEWIESSGVSPDDPLEDRVKALEGARVAINNPGGSVQALLNWALPRYDLDPDTDITQISIGDYPAMLGAMSQGEIDVFGASPPWGSQANSQGIGEVFINANEFEGLDTLPYLTADVNENDIENNPERVIALIRGMADAMEFLRENPEGGKECIREQFPDLDDASFDDTYAFAMSTIPDSPAITPERWAALEEFAEFSGSPLGVAYEDAVPVDILEEALGGR